MSDKIRKLENKVKLVGKLAELTVSTGVGTTTKIPFISIKGVVQCGTTTSQSRKFETIAQKLNKDGKENKNYQKVVNFAAKAEPLTIAKVGYEAALEVNLEGGFQTNDYINDQDELKENIKISVSFYNDYEKGTPYGITASVEGYIKELNNELAGGEDKTETGRARLSLLTVDYFGNLIPLKGLVISKETVNEGFCDFYSVGQTAKFFIDFIINKTNESTKKAGFGIQRTEEKSYYEIVIVGGDAPFDEDNEKYGISREAVKILINERKSKLEELKDAGYKGKKGKDITNNSNSSSKDNSPVGDDEIPF